MDTDTHAATVTEGEPCRLCRASGAVPVAGPGPRRFFRCPACDLVFVPSADHVGLDDEKARYALHDNSADNAGYVAFLSSMAEAVDALPLAGRRVLDFGSGPAAVLTGLLRDRGYDCTAYDPLYGTGTEAFDGPPYDAIVVCEVIEHLRDLPGELARIRAVCASGGFVLIHTLLRPEEPSAFAGWWYARDITHVNFWSARSLERMARLLGASLRSSNGRDLVVVGPMK